MLEMRMLLMTFLLEYDDDNHNVILISNKIEKEKFNLLNYLGFILIRFLQSPCTSFLLTFHSFAY